MKQIGLARLGRDAELRYLPDGTAVANLSLAVNYGKRDAQGNTPTQWIDASMWGKMVESLAQYMVKGSVHCFTLSDVHNETYQKNDGGEGFKMMARVDGVELGPRVNGGDQGGGQQRQAAPAGQQRPASAPAAAPRPAPRPAPNLSDMDDDIPF